MQGLSQVVAGRREKATFCGVGSLGGILLAGNFLRRFRDTFFEMFLTRLQLVGHAGHFAELPAEKRGANEHDDADQQPERA